MTSGPTSQTPPVNMPDAQALSQAWTRVFTNSLALVGKNAKSHAARRTAPFDPSAPLRAMLDLTRAAFSDPSLIFGAQQRFLRDWTDLCADVMRRALGADHAPFMAPERGDRRFSDPAWNEQPAFDYLKQVYLLTTHRIIDFISDSEVDPDTRTRALFYARQFLNAVSPANYPLTNPEAIRRAFETGGVSLVSGFANMLEDAASPSGLVQRRAENIFELGVNIAATPGKVVFQNELMQLIQYTPTTETVYKRPLLYVPPLVNKYYFLDLTPKSSFVRWMVEQGHTVFVISWINPGPDLAGMGMADYVKLGPVAALDAIQKATGEKVVDAFSFCMGGIILAMATAWLAAQGKGERIGSVTTIGTLFDTSDSGEWKTFYEPGHAEALERHIDERGYISSEELQSLFSVVRSNDLIWSSVVNHYLLDRTAPASDLLFWFADGAHIPKTFMLEYFRHLLHHNHLTRPGELVLDGVAIDLGQITQPVRMISLKDDHVSGWQATYAATRLFGGDVQFLLGGSGHNAGVINPPAAGKHGYWISDALPDSADAWLAGASRQDGSWWPHWQAWIAGLNGDAARVPARMPGDGKLKALEDAPGSYVRG